jgi:hypothetical protein
VITKIVTSFSLNRVDRQRFCIASWKKYGLPIIAVQCDTQIEQLKGIFGDMVDGFTVLPAKENAWDRPHLARVADHIKHTADGPILLINSDIEIRDTPKQFFDQWMGDDADTLICGVRLDHPFGNYKNTKHPYGIDAFRITPEMAKAVRDDGFVIGSPGWDYWLPWQLSQAGFRVRAANSQLMHEIHAMNYGQADVEIAHSIMEKQFYIPPHILTIWIQWVTDRVGMKHAKKKTKR